MFKNLFKKTIRLPLSEELIKLGDTYYITLTEKEKELRETNSSIQEFDSTHYISRLRSLGFTNSKLVKNETDEIEKQISLIKTIKDVTESLQFIKDVKCYFGENTLVIRMDDFISMLHKYNLVCGRFREYTGIIPEEICDELETTQNKINKLNISNARYLVDLYKNSHLIYLKNFYCRSSSISEHDTKLIKQYLNRFGMFSIPSEYTYEYTGGIRGEAYQVICKTMGVPYDNSMHCSDEDLTHMGEHLFICAPENEMLNKSASLFKVKTIEDDPLICSIGRNNESVIVHSRWGRETELPTIKKYERK